MDLRSFINSVSRIILTLGSTLGPVSTCFKSESSWVSKRTAQVEVIVISFILPLPLVWIKHIKPRRHNPVILHVSGQNFIKTIVKQTMGISFVDVFPLCHYCQD